MVTTALSGRRFSVTFFSIEKNLLRQTAIFPARGNCEHNTRTFYDLFQRGKGYYSFDWGNAHFAVINSDVANVSKIESVRAAFWEEQTHRLEEDLKAPAGFFGHDHNCQHYLKNGIHYIVSGGGGAPLYDVDKPPADITVKVASIENFVSVSVDGKSAHVQVITIDGKLLDDFDLHGISQQAAAKPEK